MIVSPGILVKYFVALLRYRAVIKALVAKGSRQLLVLTYHRVLPRKNVSPCVEPGMYVAPDALNCQLKFLKRFFTIIDGDDLKNFTNGLVLDGKPCCLITFDDGWLDFYAHAWPVLKQENVPAVVYLPTGLIGTNDIFWTDRLAQCLEVDGGHKIVASSVTRVCHDHYDAASFVRFDSALEILKKYSPLKINELLSLCELETGISAKLRGRSFMNWYEVRELYASGLISFGSHTVNHAILTTLSEDEVKTELLDSLNTLKDQKVVGEDVSFCYPNGNYTLELSEVVESCGYSSAMTCDPGWNTITDINPFVLKRISMHQDVSFTESLFAYRLNQFR